MTWALTINYKELIEYDGWKNLTSEEQINKRLIMQNTTHLAQSANTPFASGELGEAIGLDGESEVVEEILNGTFDVMKYISKEQRETHPLLEESMQAFIEALKRPTSIQNNLPLPELPCYITDEDYILMFKKTKEATSSVPPIHYGHYKAACDSEVLTYVNRTFMNVPFENGYALTRWKHSLHCMIQKKTKPFVNKLRIVQLYSADFNSVLKYILSKRMMDFNRLHGNSNHQLYAQKTKSMYDALITSRVMYDLARVKRENLISIFNNLKGN